MYKTRLDALLLQVYMMSFFFLLLSLIEMSEVKILWANQETISNWEIWTLSHAF